MPWILFALACFNLPIKLPLLFSVTKTCRKYKIFCLTPINQFLTCLLFEENKQQTSCFISSYCYNSNIQVSSSFVTYKLFFFFFFLLLMTILSFHFLFVFSHWVSWRIYFVINSTLWLSFTFSKWVFYYSLIIRFNYNSQKFVVSSTGNT